MGQAAPQRLRSAVHAPRVRGRLRAVVHSVIAHDVENHVARITAPTQITFGSRDELTSLRFASRLTSDIPGSELAVFVECAHAPIYESVDEFNEKTLEFLKHHSQPMSASV